MARLSQLKGVAFDGKGTGYVPRRLAAEAIKRELAEYARPWKLLSLAAGIALLVAGAFYYDAPDWDVPISFIMAILTYLTAPWSMRVLVTRTWRKLPLGLFYTWFTVDGCYWAYWSIKNPKAVELMRDANWPASLALYAICGLIWYYRGSLREMWIDARAPGR